MKKLIVSLKSPRESLKDFKKALSSSRKRKLETPLYKIAFDNKKDFNKFIRHFDILMTIKSMNSSSVYELAKIMKRDQSNLNKILSFFEEYGIVKIRNVKRDNRDVKKPFVNYGKIEFDLNSAQKI